MRSSKSLLHLFVVFLFASLGFPVVAQTSQPGLQADIKVALPNVRIGNFGRINPNYYRGAQPKGSDYTDLAGLGVKTVIDLTGGDGKSDEPQMVESAGMKYVHIPMTTHSAPTAGQIMQFLSIVSDPSNGPVFVHCVGGKHRTGVMTAVYRITENGWSADQAFKEMQEYKFGSGFLHSELKSFVYSYHPDRAILTRSPAAPGSTGTAAGAATSDNGPLN